jgi:hypothetical protein
LFARIGEQVRALLNTGIDRSPSTATRRSRSSRCGLLSGLLGEWDLYRSDQEARGQRGDQAGSIDET